MKTRRYTLFICMAIGGLGIVAMLLLPLLSLDDRYYSCILGLLTGFISGAFLAVATSLCELKIGLRKQKVMLFELCIAFSGCLKQLIISFEFARQYKIPPKLFAPCLSCINGPGMHYANLICTEIDDNLFLSKKKVGSLNKLRSMAMNLDPRIYRLNCMCEMLKCRTQIIELDCQSTFYASSQQVDELDRELVVEIDELFNEVASIGNEFGDEVECAILAIYGQKSLDDFRSQLLEAVNCITPQIEKAIKQPARCQRL
ncbi:hypothetical protein [Parvibacter caecicola]|uniref:Uncharacterized protein n=1 Tax=Parvibacter caecicola TaxID=747645 RepID=A0A7W5D1J9_9ACTN|nr:hypothetical protein [Parvibacter caecicola]MBB3171013.1 hypothetical protein [Parvibacter caecicola]MCR2042192.1 hypothetical protein [Parvibacter caecicola]